MFVLHALFLIPILWAESWENMIFYIFWLLVSVGLAIAFMIAVPFRLLRRTVAATHRVRDRSVWRVNLQTGISVLGEPDVTVRKYLRQYQLYQFNASLKKYFRGEWARPIACAEYSLLCFDRKDRLIDAVRVREEVAQNRFSGIVELPERTDYVSFRLHRIDERRLYAVHLNGKFFLWFSLFMLSIAAAVDFLLCIVLISMSEIFSIASLNVWGSVPFLIAVPCVALAVPAVVAMVWLLAWLLRRFLPRQIVDVCYVGRDFCQNMFRIGKTIWQKIGSAFAGAFCAVYNICQAIVWTPPLRGIHLRVQSRKSSPRRATKSGSTGEA